MGEKEFSNMERMILLQIIDSKWKEHLYELDHLKEGISYRAYGQKDPLVEYKRESFMAFSVMMDTIKREVITYLFRASGEILKSQLTGYHGEEVKPDVDLRVPREREMAMAAAQQAGPGQEGAKIRQRKVNQKVGRNDPCPCGSGKKYKYCCGR